jgi:hypothetical protein
MSLLPDLSPLHEASLNPGPHGPQMIHQDSNVVYSEVEAWSILKGFKTANAGCCKVRILHLTSLGC